ncbi:C-diamide synthase [Listeria monocytogenes]|nr:C-diamide synthase [Listeria monocytogenes]
MKWELLGDLIAEHVDLDRLLAISKTGAKLTVHPPEIQVPDFSGMRVAYAHFIFTIKITWILFAQLEPH